jgi:hypothetical protein
MQLNYQIIKLFRIDLGQIHLIIVGFILKNYSIFVCKIIYFTIKKLYALY